jgi:hypothetical protein
MIAKYSPFAGCGDPSIPSSDNCSPIRIQLPGTRDPDNAAPVNASVQQRKFKRKIRQLQHADSGSHWTLTMSLTRDVLLIKLGQTKQTVPTE